MKSFNNVATFATGKKSVLAHVSSQITPFAASLLASHMVGTKSKTATGIRLVVPGGLEIKILPTCNMHDSVEVGASLPEIYLRSKNGRMDASEVNALLAFVAKKCNSWVKFNAKTGLNEFSGLIVF